MTGIYMKEITEEHKRVREEVALANGFQLYKPYSEKEAAAFLKKDLSTLKRWRRAGMFENKFPTKMGTDGVQYLGINIADLIIWGTGKWPNEPDETPNASSLATTGSESEKEALPGIGAGEETTALSASESARRILKRRA